MLNSSISTIRLGRRRDRYGRGSRVRPDPELSINQSVWFVATAITSVISNTFLEDSGNSGSEYIAGADRRRLAPIGAGPRKSAPILISRRSAPNGTDRRRSTPIGADRRRLAQTGLEKDLERPLTILLPPARPCSRSFLFREKTASWIFLFRDTCRHIFFLEKHAIMEKQFHDGMRL